GGARRTAPAQAAGLELRRGLLGQGAGRESARHAGSLEDLKPSDRKAPAVTTLSVPQNPTAVADADPVVEVSLVPDSPVATLALPLPAATSAAAAAWLPLRL